MLSPQQLLAFYDAASLWPHGCGMELGVAYEHALAVRSARVDRGEKPLGFKIGFTNRTIWDRYQVHAPIWGTVWDTTLAFCEGQGEVPLAGTCQPRLEPEVVFGMRATPPAKAGLDELFDCIAWVAPGFEIVQSHMPGWKFLPADTVADQGLHGRLLVGRKLDVRELADTAHGLEALLANARVKLFEGEELRDEGQGANVLDGPLHALAHFLAELRNCPGAPDLSAGDVVTTGTWTDAWPLAPGQRWQACFDAPLGELSIVLT